jgi:hypothetical protein
MPSRRDAACLAPKKIEVGEVFGSPEEIHPVQAAPLRRPAR